MSLSLQHRLPSSCFPSVHAATRLARRFTYLSADHAMEMS